MIARIAPLVGKTKKRETMVTTLSVSVRAVVVLLKPRGQKKSGAEGCTFLYRFVPSKNVDLVRARGKGSIPK